MDLFDFDHDPEKINMGFRLIRLEVYNWGTFDEKIWSMELNGETSLLTGDVGSGKSTLVDALITLLVPPKKVTYNKAADASARERSLTSYILGYYGQKRSEDGTGQPEALRDRNQYSVVLAVFGDENLGARVTLAHFFWFKDETGSPERFFVLADKTLSIKHHFSSFGNDIRSLRKRLASDEYINIYDDYPRYAEDFRRRFGIRHQQAMDLFQQTISMKKVDALTTFVRQNMLEQPETENDVSSLLAHFQDLDMAHSTVVRAKKQEEMLLPLTALGESYFDLHGRQVMLEQMEEAVPLWLAQEDKSMRETALASLQQNLKETRLQKDDIASQQEETEKCLEQVQRQLYQSGGNQMSRLEEQLEQFRDQLERLKSQRQQYKEQVEQANLTMPETAAGFREVVAELPKRERHERQLELELSEAASESESEIKALSHSIDMVKEELESLKSRKSSIPAEYISIRRQLCQDLNLAESEIPFAGELLQVSEGQEEWEGALERLLHGFGLSLLVSKRHYSRLIDWMEKRSTKQRLVYYSCDDYTEPVDLETLPEEAACRKLDIRQDTGFTNWLKRELYQRFNHLCCDDVRDFRNGKYAISLNGQIKSQGRRHEKDDRFRLDDRRRYVLGFSNIKKVQAMELELEDLQEAVKSAKLANSRTKKKYDECRSRQLALNSLLQIRDYSMIDTLPIEKDIAKAEKSLQELQDGSSGYRQLERQQQTLKNEKKALDLQLQRVVVSLNNITNAINNHRQAVEADIRRLESADNSRLPEVLPRLKERVYQLLGDTSLTLAGLQDCREKLLGSIRQEQAIIYSNKEAKAQQLVAMMQSFRNAFPELADELGTAAEALGDYRRLLSRLQTDALPRFEVKFRELLRESTINRMALFQEKLNGACEVIRERIGMINKSLAAIDYSEGRYIQLECDNVVDNDIKFFRQQLRACVSSISSEQEDAYSEAKFSQVERIIERFRGRPECAEADKRWTNRVTDVRNWFSFAATERWRETGEEYEHYTDSGGKSGGQKEKLAYTVLAASLVYNFGLESKRRSIKTFRFVVIDEAFLKSSDESARFGLELFKKLDLQLLVVTPLLKIGTIEPFVSHVGFVYQDDQQHRSFLRNLTIRELEEERRRFGKGQA